MRIPVGVKVIMSERGKHKWSHSNNNPHDIVGTVTSFDEEEYNLGLAEFEEGFLDDENYFPFSVDWENGLHNVYRYGDLVPVIDLSDKTLEEYL